MECKQARITLTILADDHGYDNSRIQNERECSIIQYGFLTQCVFCVMCETKLILGYQADTRTQDNPEMRLSKRSSSLPDKCEIFLRL
jgi:uncharacterized protein YuzB (UPF0349 family)